MRVWDIHPGFLNRQSLLGEHREIHAIHTVLTKNKKGYSRHPETLRWQDHLAALWLRHEEVVAESALRGFNHFQPASRPPDGDCLAQRVHRCSWARQFALLAEKYLSKEQGRIPLPASVKELLAQPRTGVDQQRTPGFRSYKPDTPDGFAAVATALVFFFFFFLYIFFFIKKKKKKKKKFFFFHIVR